VCASAWAQEGSVVNPSEGPPQYSWTNLFFYIPASTNLEYICMARSAQNSFSWSIGSGLTSIVDAANTATVTTSTAHGLSAGNLVTISGATADTDLNGSYYVQAVGSATTFDITTANVTDTTYNSAPLAVATTAPRSSAAIWSIQKLVYSGSNLIAKQWAGGNSGFKAICDNRAVTTGTTKVTFQ
jgi:hypothetical protein